jgi:DNA-binding transcriptional LysR family regulator
MTTLTLDALQLVDAIARRGSFAGAADELGRVPSAVTYAVRRLEDDLDVLLFDRRGYRARLTPAGEELLREGRHLLAAADELTRRVRRVASGWEQELTLALDNIIPFAPLIPLLDAFHRVAPTQLRITDEVLGGTWDALLSGRADIAIGAMQEGPEPSRLGAGYRSEPIGTVHFVFAVAPNHPLAAIASPLPASEGTARSSSATPRSGWLRARQACSGWPTCLRSRAWSRKLRHRRRGWGVDSCPRTSFAKNWYAAN